jgi:hypothetical protein
MRKVKVLFDKRLGAVIPTRDLRERMESVIPAKTEIQSSPQWSRTP